LRAHLSITSRRGDAVPANGSALASAFDPYLPLAGVGIPVTGNPVTVHAIGGGACLARPLRMVRYFTQSGEGWQTRLNETVEGYVATAAK
jgi:hypothetical protein